MSEMLDLAIVGAGPAALTAALYAARAGVRVRAYERSAIGGALTEISFLANFPGFSGPGEQLAATMRRQAERAGAKVAYGECTDVHLSGDHFELIIDEEPISARTVLIATGSEPKTLDFTPRSPVSYCALCDGDLVKGQRVAVIGGGNSAVQEALYLAELAREVVVISHSQLKADQALQDQLAQKSTNLKVQTGTEVTPAILEDFDHVFVFIGKRPASSCLDSLSETVLSETPLLDPEKYIATGSLASIRQPLANGLFPEHMTIIPGLFAAGDVRAGAVRQAITAAADGAAAAIEAAAWLREN